MTMQRCLDRLVGFSHTLVPSYIARHAYAWLAAGVCGAAACAAARGAEPPLFAVAYAGRVYAAAVAPPMASSPRWDPARMLQLDAVDLPDGEATRWVLPVWYVPGAYDVRWRIGAGGFVALCGQKGITTQETFTLYHVPLGDLDGLRDGWQQDPTKRDPINPDRAWKGTTTANPLELFGDSPIFYDLGPLPDGTIDVFVDRGGKMCWYARPSAAPSHRAKPLLSSSLPPKPRQSAPSPLRGPFWAFPADGHVNVVAKDGRLFDWELGPNSFRPADDASEPRVHAILFDSDSGHAFGFFGKFWRDLSSGKRVPYDPPEAAGKAGATSIQLAHQYARILVRAGAVGNNRPKK